MKKILIVDDSPAETALMRSVLQQAGYQPVALHDSTRLEETIEAERPQLILMDVVMPTRNGFQACRELKDNPQFAQIPVVIVSSKNTDSDRFWAQNQGASDYVVKPFTAQQLLGAVGKFIP